MTKGHHNEDKIASAMQELKQGRKVTEVSRELGVSRATLYTWKAKYRRHSPPSSDVCQQLEAENRRLKQMIGELCLEIRRPVKALLKSASDH